MPPLRWFMCSGILFVGLLAALLDGDLHLGVPPAVVLGGALWALSNFVPRFYFCERLTNTLSRLSQALHSLKLTAKAPENRPNLKTEIHFLTVHFLGRTASFREGKSMPIDLPSYHTTDIQTSSIRSFT